MKAEQTEKSAGRKLDVLFVDDDRSLRRALSVIVGDIFGFTYRGVPNISDAREAIRKKAPDVILLDLIIEGSEPGEDLLRELIEANSPVRIVIVSGLSECQRLDVVRSMLRPHHDRYLRKEITMPALLAAILPPELPEQDQEG